MSMDSPPPEPAPPALKRKRSRTLFIAVIALIILAVATLALLVPHSSDEKMLWLTPAQMARAKQPRPLTRLKNRLEWVISPFRRFFHRRPKAMLLFDARIYNLSDASADKIQLGQPSSTNADGALAWILSASELSSFRDQLKAMPGLSLVNSPVIQTAEGVSAQLQTGNTVKVGGSFVMVGLTVDLIPKVSGNSYKLLIGVTDTETNAVAPSASPSIKTNFAMSCRASIPNAGALVIDGGKSGEKHYWLLLMPTLIDTTGKPIKSSRSRP